MSEEGEALEQLQQTHDHLYTLVSTKGRPGAAGQRIGEICEWKGGREAWIGIEGPGHLKI